MLRTIAAGFALVAALMVVVAAPASGAAPVECPPTIINCEIEVENPGKPGTGPGDAPGVSAGAGQCVTFRGSIVPCWHDQWGWFNASDSCYYRVRDPQPAGTDAVWEGHYPDGAIYDVSCAEPLLAPGTNGGWTWLPAPPAGYGGDPRQLADKAVEQMALEGPAIRTPLDADEIGTVGVPLWLWTEQGATTWGPNSATASVPGLSVTATAVAKWIDWDLGDGSRMRCDGPGTPYIPGHVESPTCDHVYTASSAGRPDDAYTVTGTTTWDVTWSGGGLAGSLEVTRSASTSVRIGELQVLGTS
ncbi:hypothetical protein [Actinotalea solisilvae]|uniref:hypothetical protein n=1 Tax=Actinotalea solisilvae TaxID=2072922 RepID=UPI0018F255F1|nr:hypothetical protein [Actinotalea solisilvae]